MACFSHVPAVNPPTKGRNQGDYPLTKEPAWKLHQFINDITTTSQTGLVTFDNLPSESYGDSVVIFFFQKRVENKKIAMGKFKNILTCLGAGIAAGAGYFLYRKYISRDGEQEKDSFTQVKIDRLRAWLK